MLLLQTVQELSILCGWRVYEHVYGVMAVATKNFCVLVL